MALPQPLPPSEAARIKRIFALQAKNEIPAALAELAQVSDTLLLPDILADRYLNGLARPRQADLTAWLAQFRDLPDAAAIHALLAKEAPSVAAAMPMPPAIPALPTVSAGDDVEPSERVFPRNALLDREVHEIARISSARALNLIGRTRGISRIYGAQLRAEVAQILFGQGEDSAALKIAVAADRQAEGDVGLASFVAGLAEWRMGHPIAAEAWFKSAFAARYLQPGQRAGAAFWAARALEAQERTNDRDAWLRRASESGRTFYGLLARRTLGDTGSPYGGIDNFTLGEADVDAIDATDAGHRAFALLQVGQNTRAAAELQLLWSQTRGKAGFSRSIMLVARQAGLTALAEQFAQLFERAPVHLPDHRLHPKGGFKTDPALIYALARLESNFDPRAVSPAGARGIMQLMPSTVDFITGKSVSPKLHDPSVSLEIGQRYLLMLAQYDLVGGDLIRLLASYNSGPGSVGKWIGSIRHNGDPLLFIESVPNEETRGYIPRALAYTWLYAAELGLPSPSLDDLAAGSWPRFREGPKSVIARLP
ncbi:MAG: lytic transglycosylase domain-containing protein [Acetobacteraceae bacterium]|nr:lytic transglycosylase domain-containing protein [Acetobacteraceae bacterium]